MSWYDPAAPAPAASPTASPSAGRRPPPPPPAAQPDPQARAASSAVRAPRRPPSPHPERHPVGLAEEDDGVVACLGDWADAELTPEEISAIACVSKLEGPAAVASAARAVPAPAAASAAGVPARAMDVLEVVRSVDQATKMKEQLAKDSISRAQGQVMAARAALQAEMKEQERRLKEEEQRLGRLELELRAGCNGDERTHIEALRKEIETTRRDQQVMERDVASKREAMRRATDAYVDAEDKLSAKRTACRKLEERMTELILSMGRAKDERLTGLLLQAASRRLAARRGVSTWRPFGSYYCMLRNSASGP